MEAVIRGVGGRKSRTVQCVRHNLNVCKLNTLCKPKGGRSFLQDCFCFNPLGSPHALFLLPELHSPDLPPFSVTVLKGLSLSSFLHMKTERSKREKVLLSITQETEDRARGKLPRSLPSICSFCHTAPGAECTTHWLPTLGGQKVAIHH